MIAPVKFKEANFLMSIPSVSDNKTYPGGNVQECILKTGMWAKEETAILLSVLRKQKGLVVDIGANTGYFSFVALSQGCNVVACEPNSIHTKYFMETVKLNNFSSDSIKHLEVFVSTKQNIQFDGWSAYETLRNDTNHIPVQTMSLKDVCNEGCLFLKIDVEGFEPDVLLSGESLLAESKIPYIMLEITYIIGNKIDDLQIEMLRKLRNYSFDMYEIQPHKLLFIDDISKKAKQWEFDFFNHHKKHTPSITNAGCNIIAVLKGHKLPEIS